MDYDFSFFLVAATFVTGAVWGGYALWLKRHPLPEGTAHKEPILVEYARSFFPIVLVVMLLRSFLVEPFRIPSGSMMPTLLIGDFILVNKFTYGIRLPVLNTKIIEMNEPQRGDIVVFRFPKDPTVDYIKRVIGLPGDRIGYYNKQLYVNGKPMPQTSLGIYQGVGQGASMSGAELLSEDLEGVEHDILIRHGQPTVQGEFTVPEGSYFVMGDNRDNSNDSRYWGVVPEANLVGKAFFIWMSWDFENGGIGFSRLGTVLNSGR
ncbi:MULTISPECIES: signal peptidase I [Methylococcus]|jgi:signal peptidase I|uniref:Signal peptidase I n=1 Tax=Methylococcus capsulatus TaxID=414 RepID=A0AA35UFQ5_METCP|nr:signal peptidase I [Methylococcus capsulatus]QXP87836.1 signal peptidase I [Methylococcus capsulatus]QXP90809.1 signal peptidase I [Methylococcus capsulatus]QXP92424.1 signal peptidase I [Methylococcus capsulatus]UQN12858.1 signal peptidase I [Methylococcus capsulatus]CAI8885508.1 signal peptidase I [Methylococcus capsulatus]